MDITITDESIGKLDEAVDEMIQAVNTHIEKKKKVFDEFTTLIMNKVMNFMRLGDCNRVLNIPTRYVETICKQIGL